jgi:hypothetical protein
MVSFFLHFIDIRLLSSVPHDDDHGNDDDDDDNNRGVHPLPPPPIRLICTDFKIRVFLKPNTTIKQLDKT